MKLPRPPPARRDLPGETLRSDPRAFSVEQDGKYLHWDELRRRPARPQLSHEDWWAAIKVARGLIARPTPLADASGRSITFCMTDTVQRLVHEVDRDTSGRVELPEDVTAPSTRDRYIFSSLVEEATRSSQLEGASTTRKVAKEMIRARREPRTDGERMIFNNYRGMQWVREHRGDDLSPTRIFELHAIVTRGTLEEGSVGRFRRAEEDIGVHDPLTNERVFTPPPADQLIDRVAAMCRFANGPARDDPFTHPVLRAILLHFWLAYDHPFVDGNGRTARLLFYWSMLRQDYWLTEYIPISGVIRKARVQYDQAFLHTESDENDATYFLLNQLGVLRTAIDDLFAYLRRKAREVRDLEAQLRGREDLNHRQLALLGAALRHPENRFTIEAHQSSHGVAYQTARTDLLGLAAAGFLVQRKSGKKLVFVPASDLERRLGPRR